MISSKEPSGLVTTSRSEDGWFNWGSMLPVTSNCSPVCQCLKMILCITWIASSSGFQKGGADGEFTVCQLVGVPISSADCRSWTLKSETSDWKTVRLRLIERDDATAAILP